MDVLVVIFDGPENHISMMKEIGGNMNYRQINNNF